MGVRQFRLGAILLLALAGASDAWASPDYYAVVIQALQPAPKFVQVEKFEINETDELHRLLTREVPATLTKDQYEKLPRIPLGEVVSFKVASKVLQARGRTGAEFYALPREFKNFPKTPTDPAMIIRGSTLRGRTATKQPFSDTLREGYVVYIFTTSPGADVVAFSVAEAQNTQEGWDAFLQKFPRSPKAPDAAKPLVEIYLGRSRGALDSFQAALTEKKPGYGQLGEARKWLNEALRWVGMVKPPAPPVNEVQEKITQRENDIRDRISRSRQLAENNDCPNAQQALEPILHFRDELAEIGSTMESNLDVCARHRIARARELRGQKDFDGANRELEAAAQYRRLPEIDREREEIAKQRALEARQKDLTDALGMAKEAAGRNDYGSAFRRLVEITRKFPEESGVQAFLSEVQKKYAEELLGKSEQERKLYAEDLASEDSVLGLLVELDRMVRFGPPAELAPRLRVERDALSRIIADHSYKQYGEMTKGAAAQNPSVLAFAYVQQACQYGPERCPADVPTQRGRVERELRVGVVLNFRDVSPTKVGGDRMEAELQARVSEAIGRSGLPRVDAMERRGETAAQAQAADLEFIIELLDAEMDEESRQEQVNSEHSPGTRQVTNPKWAEAKAAYDLATANLEQVRNRLANPPKKNYGKKEKQADQTALPRLEANARAAKTALDGASQFVEQEDLRPYQFTRRAVTRTAHARISSRWVNVATGVRGEQRFWGEGEGDRETVQGEEVSGVQAGDKRGNTNRPLDLPDRNVLLPRVLGKLQQQLADHAVTYLKSTFIGGYFDQARQKAARGERDAAAEDYIRFLYNSPPDAEPSRREQALAYLRERRLVALDWLGAAER